MKIVALQAKEILNSRAIPTVECSILLDSGHSVTASVPSGTSKGLYEAVELRDGGNRFMGLGVQKAVAFINDTIAPLFVGKAPDCIEMDQKLLALDNTPNKEIYGANTLLAVSIALFKAHAVSSGLEIYELLAHACGFETVGLPVPLYNVINGGLHADNNLKIQEFIIVPFGLQTLHETIEVGIMFFNALKDVCKKHGLPVAYGDEGGISSSFTSDEHALDVLMETVAATESSFEGGILFALDVAASRFYNPETNQYQWQGKEISSAELIAWYEHIADNYPLYAVEDGMSELDWHGWEALYAQLGSKIHSIGDDIFVSQSERIWQGIERNTTDGVIIKPNQVGTVTEALQAIALCKEHDKKVIVSHRSGETNDTFIADLAVAASATHIKCGGFSGGERISKYNRLLEIERMLLEAQLGQK